MSWSTYRGSIGDRSALFSALAETWGCGHALYPGSYVDLSPSTAFPEVTYVDTDRRAARYFDDAELVRSELRGRTRPSAGVAVRFIAADYTEALPLSARSFDLLISLYAGPVWQHCRPYLKPGGLLLANASHGDASLAALDPDLRLVAAVLHRSDHYRLDTDALDRYLVAKNPAANQAAAIRQAGRGIAYTRPAFAYVFASEHVASDPAERRIPGIGPPLPETVE